MTPFYSVQHWLDDFLKYMPEALIPAHSLDPFRPWLMRWPAEIIAGYTLEARLAADQPQVDFSFNVEQSRRRQLASAVYTLTDNPIWERLYSLIMCWNIREHPLHDRLERIWFEFDGNAEHIDVPGLCFRAVENNQLRNGNYFWKHNPDMFLDTIFPLLTNQLIEQATRCQLQNCLDQLPPEVDVVYMCLMLSRQRYYPRLLLEGFSPDTLLAYLDRIHWMGDKQALARLLDRDIPTVDEVCLDVGEHVIPSIGIESWGAKSELKETERWRRILEPLVRDGLCVPEKAEAMLSWFGASVGQLPFHTTPMYMWRIIDHLKFVVAPDGSTQAKAYLSWHAVEK